MIIKMEGDPIKIKEILDKYNSLIMSECNIKSTYIVCDPCKPIYNSYDYSLEPIGQIASLYISHFNLEENDYHIVFMVEDFEIINNKFRFKSNKSYNEIDFEKGLEHFKNSLLNIKKLKNEIRLNQMIGDFK